MAATGSRIADFSEKKLFGLSRYRICSHIAARSLGLGWAMFERKNDANNKRDGALPLERRGVL